MTIWFQDVFAPDVIAKERIQARSGIRVAIVHDGKMIVESERVEDAIAVNRKNNDKHD